ncbi:MAG: DUF3667 domain-containing protein [candidate division KSB1 bacterium]|nr:DUF3667 domain-containing protein [candidate division KSB1 bacterium]
MPFRQMLSEFFGDLLSFDSRLLRTLLPLLFKPGQLTRNYLAGQRIRYVPPVRLYIFISFLFFLSLAVTDVRIISIKISPSPKTRPPSASPRADTTAAAGNAKASQAPGGTLEESVQQKFLKNLQTASRDPQLLNQMLIGRLSRLMFILVPIFALLLKLLYRRLRGFYIQHLIFALHYHAFAFLIFTFMIGLYVLGAAALTVPIAFVLPVYLFLAMKRVYGQSAPRTLLKGITLMAGYLMALMISLAGMTWLMIYLYDQAG